MDNKPLMDQISVVDRESRDLHTNMLKALHIKLIGATLNRNDGYQLPDLYTPLLHEEAMGENPPLTPAQPRLG